MKYFCIFQVWTTKVHLEIKRGILWKFFDLPLLKNCLKCKSYLFFYSWGAVLKPAIFSPQNNKKINTWIIWYTGFLSNPPLRAVYISSYARQLSRSLTRYIPWGQWCRGSKPCKCIFHVEWSRVTQPSLLKTFLKMTSDSPIKLRQ